MNLCKLCRQPIRKTLGHESRPGSLACWVHTTGRYQCPGSRSEYDLATYDPASDDSTDLSATTPPTLPSPATSPSASSGAAFSGDDAAHLVD
jgi:hypothetical protein